MVLSFSCPEEELQQVLAEQLRRDEEPKVLGQILGESQWENLWRILRNPTWANF